LSLEAADEHTIIFGEMMIWKTRRNLEADARVSILVLSADLRGWTVRGRFVEFQRGGAYFDHIMESESIRYNAYSGIRSAGVIQVLDVARTFKLSQAGLLIDTARSRWLARRLSRNGSEGGAMPLQVREKFSRLKAAKVAAYLDASGHPDCLPALPLAPAGPARLVWGGHALEDLTDLTPGSPLAAAVEVQERCDDEEPILSVHPADRLLDGDLMAGAAVVVRDDKVSEPLLSERAAGGNQQVVQGATVHVD
ncbi:unnamed protein product, partial [marine sediment metagenome]